MWLQDSFPSFLSLICFSISRQISVILKGPMTSLFPFYFLVSHSESQSVIPKGPMTLGHISFPLSTSL